MNKVENWKSVKLKFFAKAINGFAFNSNDYCDDGIQIVRIGNIKKDGRVDLSNAKKVPSVFLKLYSSVSLMKNDIVMAMTGATIRKVGRYLDDKPGLLNQRVCKFLPHTIDRDFLWFILQSNSYLEHVFLTAGGGAQANISDVQLLDYKTIIPIPFIQSRIASFLDQETFRIDTLIAKKERQIELLQEKRQAIITQAVTKGLDPNAKMKDSGVEWIGEIPEGWDLIKLKYISTKVNSGKTPRGGSESYQDKGIMLIRSQNVYFDGLRLDDVVFIDEETDQEMRNSRVQPMDVLLNITGASIGRSYYVPKDFPASNVNQHVCIIRPDRIKVITEYLWLCMASSIIQKVVFSFEKGTSREGITFEQIRNFDIPLPMTVEEQSSIVETILAEIDRNDRIVNIIQKSIDLLKEYRSSMITHAVTGQIDIENMEKGK